MCELCSHCHQSGIGGNQPSNEGDNLNTVTLYASRFPLAETSPLTINHNGFKGTNQYTGVLYIRCEISEEDIEDAFEKASPRPGEVLLNTVHYLPKEAK